MVPLVKKCTSDFADYLSDESRRCGSADFIAFPKTEAEIVSLLKENESPITVQGALTGITGGAVPSDSGLIINLERMNTISEIRSDNGEYLLTVQPGVRLDEIRAVIEPEGLFFPTDPTETTASIGGMVSCNASGARSFKYGPIRPWISALKMVLADGDTVSLARGKQRANGRQFQLQTEEGKIIEGMLPEYKMPDVKSAAGYFIEDNMELIDLFIGSEGTLGIISEIEIKLILQPKQISGLCLFLPSLSAVLNLVEKLRTETSPAPSAIEYFDERSLNLIRKSGIDGIPELKPHFKYALYTEFIGDDVESIEAVVMQVAEHAIELEADDDDMWLADNPGELATIKAFRHAAPEAVNQLIGERKRQCPELTKLGTDMSVPDSELENILRLYCDDLQSAALDHIIFGHIGNNHLHVNIIPRNMSEYAQGKELYKTWAEKVVSLGGSVSAEHGIGKSKIDFLKRMYGEVKVEQMRRLKALFDPLFLLCPENLF